MGSSNWSSSTNSNGRPCSSSGWRTRRLGLWAQFVYSKFSNSISYDHQLLLRHVLALDNCLQVQQCLQSCLFTSIKWILCKLRLFRNNKLLDIIFQLVYAYGCWLGAIDIPPCRRLVSSVTPNWRSRLCCCTRRNCVGSLHAYVLAPRAVNSRNIVTIHVR